MPPCPLRQSNWLKKDVLSWLWNPTRSHSSLKHVLGKRALIAEPLLTLLLVAIVLFTSQHSSEQFYSSSPVKDSDQDITPQHMWKITHASDSHPWWWLYCLSVTLCFLNVMLSVFLLHTLNFEFLWDSSYFHRKSVTSGSHIWYHLHLFATQICPYCT